MSEPEDDRLTVIMAKMEAAFTAFDYRLTDKGRARFTRYAQEALAAEPDQEDRDILMSAVRIALDDARRSDL